MAEALKNVLVKKADQVRNTTELLLDKTRDWQIIKQHLCNRLGDLQLTPQQEEKKNRYQFVYNQLVSGKYTETEVVTQLMNFYGIKQSQAYEDINSAKEIFPSFININKRFEIIVELQILSSARQKCIEVGDHKSAAAYQKNKIALLALLGDDEVEQGELFEGHTIEATFDPRLLGAPDIDMNEVLRAINEKRQVKIKIDMFNELNAEEIDHEDLQP